jgi:hypothetical protein
MTLSRRRLLAAVAGVGAAGAAGCLGFGVGSGLGVGNENGDGDGTGGEDGTDGPVDVTEDPTRTTTTTTTTTTSDEIPLARHGYPPTICEDPIKADPGIYAVVDPAFDRSYDGYDVPAAYEPDDDDVVIGLARDGVARAYPVSILYHHEVVNDRLDVPVLVTFCPLCNSGMVADRRVGGEPTDFLVTGLLWRAPGIQSAAREESGDVFGLDGNDTDREVRNAGNLVMYDRGTRSYWSQLLATAICGDRRGTELSILPSTVATWGEWRDAHPDVEVLLPPPYSGTDDPDSDPES